MKSPEVPPERTVTIKDPDTGSVWKATANADLLNEYRRAGFEIQPAEELRRAG